MTKRKTWIIAHTLLLFLFIVALVFKFKFQTNIIIALYGVCLSTLLIWEKLLEKGFPHTSFIEKGTEQRSGKVGPQIHISLTNNTGLRQFIEKVEIKPENKEPEVHIKSDIPVNDKHHQEILLLQNQPNYDIEHIEYILIKTKTNLSIKIKGRELKKLKKQARAFLQNPTLF